MVPPVLTSPDGLDLLAFFEAEPVEETGEGFWAYEIDDASGLRMRLGVDEIAGSAQIDLALAGRHFAMISYEGLEAIRLLNGALFLDFKLRGSKSALEIRVKPVISMKWYTLEV